MKPIYLDYLATTPLDAHVVGAMEPFLREHFGNPSSTHVYSQAAHEAVACARSQSPRCSARNRRRSSSRAAPRKQRTMRSRASSSPR